LRDSKEIRVWMIRNGHTIESIRQSLGYANHTSVSLTIAGQRNHRKVLDHLLELGCPEQHLDLPQHEQGGMGLPNSMAHTEQA